MKGLIEMSATMKRVLLGALIAVMLAGAFLAAYSITAGRLSGNDVVTPEASATAAPAADVTSADGQTTLPEATSAGETATEPTTAPVTTAPVTTEPRTTAAPTPADTASPTYINGILVVNKSYPLPRDYDPGGLTDECESAFYTMQAAAENEGLDLYIASGFRSYDLQASLYQRYCNADGQAAADTYSARPGHSEHQSGLAIDLNSISSDFAYTEEGRWVAAHCWEYGFILRYPADKVSITGYMYEPWHIRYVGRDVAAAIYQSGLCLEEYLGIDSVYSY